MKASQYRFIGWGIFIICLLLALHWCLSQTGPAGFLMERSEAATGKRLVQISWVITFVLVGLPGYLVKNHFEEKAWDAHVKTLPTPSRSESARRSKYIQADSASLAPPKAVPISEIPKGQQEYIATCPACGNFFSARADDQNPKCPTCGETLPDPGK